MISKEAVLTLLGDRPIAYHPILAKKLGGVEVAVFLSQLLYWTGKSKLPGGWIFKTQIEFEEETGLTRRNQDTARLKLKELGVLEEVRKGIPATMHYRVNLEKLAKLLTPTQQTRLAECAKLDCTNAPNLNGGIVQTPEITTETTPQITTKDIGPITSKLMSICRINPGTITKRQKQHLSEVMDILINNNATVDQLARFETFWAANWRSKDNAPPSLLQVVELWGEFENWKPEMNHKNNGVNIRTVNGKNTMVIS